PFLLRAFSPSSRTIRFTGAALPHWMKAEPMCAPRPVQPLVGRRPQRPYPPTLVRSPRPAPAPHAKLRRGSATRCPKSRPLVCAPPNLVPRSPVGRGQRAAPPPPSPPPLNNKVHRRGATTLDH